MNLLQPLTFESFGEAGKYAQRHRCALCLLPLLRNGLEVNCPEHGVMYAHTVTSIHTADQVTSDRSAAGAELREKPNLTAEQIIKELYNE